VEHGLSVRGGFAPATAEAQAFALGARSTDQFERAGLGGDKTPVGRGAPPSGNPSRVSSGAGLHSGAICGARHIRDITGAGAAPQDRISMSHPLHITLTVNGRPVTASAAAPPERARLDQVLPALRALDDAVIDHAVRDHETPQRRVTC